MSIGWIRTETSLRNLIQAKLEVGMKPGTKKARTVEERTVKEKSRAPMARRDPEGMMAPMAPEGLMARREPVTMEGLMAPMARREPVTMEGLKNRGRSQNQSQNQRIPIYARLTTGNTI